MKKVGLVPAAAVGVMLLIGCAKEVTQSPAQSFAARPPVARATAQPRGTRVSAFGAPNQPATQAFVPVPRATFTPFTVPRAARPTTLARGQALQTTVASATAGVRSQQLGQPYAPAQQPYAPGQQPPYPSGQQPYLPDRQPYYPPGQEPYYPTDQPPYQSPGELYGEPGPAGPYGPPGMMPYGPGAWVGGLTYVVHTGDTLYNIAHRFGVTVEDLAAANGIPDLWRVEVGRVLFIPVSSAPVPAPVTTYIVRRGDTLYSIAKRFGLPLEVLASANGIPDPQRIFVGQRLMIPCDPPCSEPIVQQPVPPAYETPYAPGYPAPSPIETPYPPYYPADTPTPVGPPPSSSTYLYSSVDGKFSVQYPASWQNGTDNPSGYVVFWSQESTDPFSAGIAILSRTNPTWRPSQQVLDDYKAALPGLMAGRLGGASFVWDNQTTPVTLAGNLAIADYGYAQISGANRDRLWAQAVNVGGQDYLALAWAPPDLWSAYQSQLTSLIDTVAFLP